MNNTSLGVRTDRRSQEIRSGGTLSEVIVSITAIGFLAICLMPAVASVRNSSKEAVCHANLARIGFANSVYASQDLGDAAIPVHRKQFQQDPNHPIYIGAYEWGGKSGIGRDDFLTGTAGNPLNSRYGTQAGFGPATRPLNRILYRDELTDYANDPGDNGANWLADTRRELSTNECPADVGYTGVHYPSFRDSGLSSYDHFGTSYAANIFMIGRSGGSNMYSNSPYLHRMSQLASPVTTIAYQENNGRFAWAAAPEVPECTDVVGGIGISGSVIGWHGKPWTFNVAFLDGHTDAIYMRGYSNPRLGRYPDLGSEEGSYQQYQCIIVRGMGWQKDTMPADFVLTNLIAVGGGRPSYEDGIE